MPVYRLESVSVPRLCVSIRRALIYVVGAVVGVTSAPAAVAAVVVVVAERDARRRGGYERESEVSLCVRARFLSPFPSHVHARARARTRSRLRLARSRPHLPSRSPCHSRALLARSLARSHTRPSVGWRARARALTEFAIEHAGTTD